MNKIVIKFYIFLLSIVAFSQEKGNLFGGFETNGQWYVNDNCLKDEFDNPTVQPEITPLRSNSYLSLNYKYKNWTAGVQGEGYYNEALANMNPKYRKFNLATYFLQYKNEKLDITLGYFYEQFGSGLLYRSWEDRALGINNALRGGRIIFKPANFLTIKSIIGQQRTGFDVANSKIYGTDADIKLSDIFKFENTDLSLGLSYVGRDEEIGFENQKFNDLTNGYAARMSLNYKSFYLSSEYNYKSDDAVVQFPGQLNNRLIKPGSALLFNIGYSRKGFGIDATFRRIENMSFFSERAAKGNNFNDRIMNFIPSLTKQHHFNTANIYVFQAQPNVLITSTELAKTGEIGGQVDVFYEFKKGSKIGGKYGTKIALNVSNFNALSGTFYLYNPQDYKTDFFGFGKRYFTDFNIEITKKWNSKLQTIFSYINQYYNKKLIESTKGEVKSNIIAAEATYRFTTTRSIRGMIEHLWADHDKKNWAGATVELNLNSKLSFYVSDLYNYGNELDYYRNHYYNVGGAYRIKSTRIALNYGRQRGGLVCVGGVCRIVNENAGLSISANTSF